MSYASQVVSEGAAYRLHPKALHASMPRAGQNLDSPAALAGSYLCCCCSWQLMLTVQVQPSQQRIGGCACLVLTSLSAPCRVSAAQQGYQTALSAAAAASKHDAHWADVVTAAALFELVAARMAAPGRAFGSMAAPCAIVDNALSALPAEVRT